ncbi:unnamed protein product [Symbiodinium natans]|uniref:C3H1-type domain-containing protein n=1 Tax=Symbiodinium natans TaxID=878477 RepID=A0A812SN56_9DINO|nr:unnamed protein product [Symbiodinium natans]
MEGTVEVQEAAEKAEADIETPVAADAASGSFATTLSKRQRQRLRQRQAGEDARASGRKAERLEAPVKRTKKAEVATETTGASAPAAEAKVEAADIPADGSSSGEEPKADDVQEPPRSWADIAAGRPPRPLGDESETAKGGQLSFAVDAPDFVPLAAMTEMPFQGIITFFPIQGSENAPGYWAQAGVTEDMINGSYVSPFQWSCDPNCLLDTKFSSQIHQQFHKTKRCVEVSCLSSETSASSFMKQLDAWGLAGTYDFLHVVNGGDTCTAIINFIDPVFVMLFCCICQEYNVQGNITMADVQGLEALTKHWSRLDVQSDATQPVILPDARPKDWAVNAVNHMLSPQPFKHQFRKTKMCAYIKKKTCELGPGCPFAHSKAELQPMPDLVKTKLCHKYFQRRCTDIHCKFAHGSAELRSVWTHMPYGTWPLEEAGWHCNCCLHNLIHPVKSRKLPVYFGRLSIGILSMRQAFVMHGTRPRQCYVSMGFVSASICSRWG